MSVCLCDVLCNKYVLGTIVILIIVKIYMKLTTGVCCSKRRLDGKTVIVTGANTGIGKETARDLAKRGAHVILACRSIAKANEARDEIIASTRNRGDVIVKHLDLASLNSVRQFAKDIISTEERLDILVNNAGVGGVGMKMTKDNLLLGMQANHFGPFLLTNLLIGLLKKSAPSRIIFVSSIIHHNAKLDMNNLNGEKSSIHDYHIYANSKLANILTANELAHKLEGTGVTVNSLHPGTILTDIWRHVPQPFRTLALIILRIFFKNVVEGAQTTIHLAVSEGLEGVTGKYFVDCQETKPSKYARDEALAKKLWEKSEELVKLSKEERL